MQFKRDREKHRRVCLVGWILGRVEKKKEKKRTFLVGIWFEGGEGKKWVGPGCFVPGPTKMFSP